MNVIFAIDDEKKIKDLYRHFYTHPDTTGTLIPCVGSYRGVQEASYICSADAFERVFLYDTHGFNEFIRDQESFLYITQDNKQTATLHYKNGFDTKEFIGFMKSVDERTAKKQDAWTYRPDVDTYWIAVKDNPDTVPNNSTKLESIYNDLRSRAKTIKIQKPSWVWFNKKAS